ncbi:PTS glucose transporter subunit IIA [Cryobacterium sandaracinum]|nr:PTS glucose transporter subunit IIA [Cryobacterium sandaracinum]
MPENILSPLRGTAVSLSDVPDPVFAQEIVGGGVAFNPPRKSAP